MNLQKLLTRLEDLDDRCAEFIAADIVNEVSEWAAKSGYASLVRDWTPAAQVIEVRRYLAECIAATAEKPQSDPLLTPPEIAKQLEADPATVIQWIRSGQLRASNLATGHRPRYVVQPADLEAFLKARQPMLRQRKRS